MLIYFKGRYGPVTTFWTQADMDLSSIVEYSNPETIWFLDEETVAELFPEDAEDEVTGLFNLQEGNELANALDDALEMLDNQIDAVLEHAQMQAVNPFRMQNMAGDFILAPLLVAKVQLLDAMTRL